MIIDLTEEQVAALQPMQDKIHRMFSEGAPGVMLAQVMPNSGEMSVRLIEHDKALKIQEIIGEIQVGETF